MRSVALSLVVLGAAFCAACNSTDTSQNPLLVTDTFDIAAPTANLALPSALDITAVGDVIAGGRHPELESDASEWDFALRFSNGQLTLVPAGAIGVLDSGGKSHAGITEALAGKTFEGVTQAPGSSSFISDRGVTMQVGAVYVARSRLITCGFSTVQEYAKLQPLAIDVTQQRMQLQVTTNERCGDQRLTGG